MCTCVKTIIIENWFNQMNPHLQFLIILIATIILHLAVNDILYLLVTFHCIDKVLRNYIQNHKFVSLDQIYFYKTKQISCTTRKSNNLRLITRTYQNPIDREQYSLKRTSPLKYEYCGNFYVTILFLLQ